MIHLFGRSRQPASFFPAWVSPFKACSIVNRSARTIFSGIGHLFQLSSKGVFKILKDCVHRPSGFFYTLVKIAAGSWLCHLCVTSPQFHELNLGAQTGMFIAGWISYLVIDAVLHWSKDTLGIKNLLQSEKKPLTRAFLSLAANGSIMYALQMPGGNYASMLFQGIYTYLQTANLSETFMQMIDKARSTNDMLTPITTLLHHPLTFFCTLGNFMKDTIINPKRAALNFHQGLSALFEKFINAYKDRNWRELLARAMAILLPTILAASIILSMALTAGISTAMIIVAATLGLLCAYILTQACNEHWPRDD